MKKNLYLIYLFCLLSFSLYSCNDEINYDYSKLQPACVSGFDMNYSIFCLTDFSYNFENNASYSSFYGEYQRALELRSMIAPVSKDPLAHIDLGGVDKANVMQLLKSILENTEANDSDKLFAHHMLNQLNAPSVEERFATAKSVPAIRYITEQAKDYHFTLINEAHYSSQHRSFTSDLLAPLWEEGYRYLAMEALTYGDISLSERGYPTYTTGFYIRDSNFGNMVREALRLGYTLVPYESVNGNDGTLRDTESAINILESTWKQDQKGKVLIHAGYGHISEMGDEGYEPLGYQLKNLIGKDILTIDQLIMEGYTDVNKQHHYYREAMKISKFTEPQIFLDKEDMLIIEPVSTLGYDLQVYHPETKFISGRPDWLYKKGFEKIPLSKELLQYQGHLVQAVLRGEASDAVPVDQFIIGDDKVFILAKGSYDLRVINCRGDMVGSVELEVR